MKNTSVYTLMLVLALWGCQYTDHNLTTNYNPYELNLDFKPNIIWLVAEDLSPVIPPYGDSTVVTPTLSRLAAEGICFDHAFSPSPVCPPSRAALATGMYPTRIAAGHMRTGPWYASDPSPQILERHAAQMAEGIGIYEAKGPPEMRMFSEYLREDGYYCTNNSKQDYQFRCSKFAWDENGRDAHWKNRKPGQPFFAIFNFGVTHESQIWRRQNDSLLVDADLDVPVPPYLPDTEIGLQDVRRMYSNIKLMDQQIGEKIAELEAAGLLDSSIVFWYADHGGPLPRQKRLIYDSGLRIPLMVRFPNKMFAGQRDDRLVSFIDFGPTVLSLCSIETPTHVNGKPFLGAYTAAEVDYIYAAADRFDELSDCTRAIRDKRYKYVKYYNPEKEMIQRVGYREQMPIMQELNRLEKENKLTPEQALWFAPTKPEEAFYDILNDPYELNNIIEDPTLQSKIDSMRELCAKWSDPAYDTGRIPEPELIQKIAPNGFERVPQPEVIANNNRIELSSDFPGAICGYKIKGAGNDAWNIYSEPVALSKNDTLLAIADRIGFIASDTLLYVLNN